MILEIDRLKSRIWICGWPNKKEEVIKEDMGPGKEKFECRTRSKINESDIRISELELRREVVEKTKGS